MDEEDNDVAHAPDPLGAPPHMASPDIPLAVKDESKPLVGGRQLHSASDGYRQPYNEAWGSDRRRAAASDDDDDIVMTVPEPHRIPTAHTNQPGPRPSLGSDLRGWPASLCSPECTFPLGPDNIIKPAPLCNTQPLWRSATPPMCQPQPAMHQPTSSQIGSATNEPPHTADHTTGCPLPSEIPAIALTDKQKVEKYGLPKHGAPAHVGIEIGNFERWCRNKVDLTRPERFRAIQSTTFGKQELHIYAFLGFCMR